MSNQIYGAIAPFLCLKTQEAVALLNREYLQSFSVSKETRTYDIQKICCFIERQTVYDWHTASFQGRNNYCKTDPDATFMHMKDDHREMHS